MVRLLLALALIALVPAAVWLLVGPGQDSASAVPVRTSPGTAGNRPGATPTIATAAEEEAAGGVEPARLVGTFALEPGWGALLELRGPEGAPLTGVEVLLDGQAQARSDVQGLAALARDRQPGSIQVHGWSPWSPNALDPGALTRSPGVQSVLLLPAQ